MARPAWPYLERYGYTWIQHPDSLYYGPFFLGADDHLVWLEERGTLGHIASCGVGSIGISCASRGRRRLTATRGIFGELP
jgi:hypothetical protein